ncbi:MAG: ribulose-phosphate 3-epimerase [Paludibacteraceae bacterium]|nr:ribulose-phosphate 3-epimerase [Paludibacteraceae bacterium]
MAKIVAPSLLSANFGNLAADVEMVNKSDAEWLHLDIMDGVFVPNISFGIPVVKAVRKLTDKFLDTHLMIVEPDKYIDRFADCGVDMLNLHYEACTHLHRAIQHIHSRDMKAGVTLNPSSPVSLLEDIVCDVDMVLLMAVNPGFGGQPFIENTYNKVTQLKELLLRKNSNALIEVDGGVNHTNAPKLFEAGADVLVAGQYVFGSKNPHEAIRKLLQ